MAQVRLLYDLPDGRAGEVVEVSPRRAQELTENQKAERVIVRHVTVETAVPRQSRQ